MLFMVFSRTSSEPSQFVVLQFEYQDTHKIDESNDIQPLPCARDVFPESSCYSKLYYLNVFPTKNICNKEGYMFL